MAAPDRTVALTRARRSRRSRLTAKNAILASLIMPGVVSAQDSDSCISLRGSSACPAFSSASISTNSTLVQTFPFLQYVSDRKSFDEELSSFVRTSYVQSKYQSVFGCGEIELTNSSNYYARFTTTLVCNSIVQMSIAPCGLSEDQSRPLCADSCAEFAQSEAYVTSDDNLCSDPVDDLDDLIRSDFAICSLPGGTLDSSKCISGIDNEPENCGYGNSTLGLCSYCGSGGLNSTDTCCYNANAEDRCDGVQLPSLTATMTFSATTETSPPTSTGTNSADNDNQDGADGDGDGDGGLSGGAIAGIVVGSIAAIAILALLLFFCLRRRRRPGSAKGSIFNQPSPARQGPSTTQEKGTAPQGYEVLPGGRIARMSALEGHSGDSPSHHRDDSSTIGGVGAVVGYQRRGVDNSSSDEYGGTPESDIRAGILRPPPTKPRRHGSLSSSSALGSSDPQSPGSVEGFSSPQGMASQQSEQLPFFKDYYSSDDIHPGDRVAVLWAYQPRAADEFSLERGDMLKVVGIWDDGWATGILLNERAEDWEGRRPQRDSGVSNASGHRDSSPAAEGQIKALPLVCVCLPEHWRKTIEGDGSTESGSNGFDPLS